MAFPTVAHSSIYQHSTASTSRPVTLPSNIAAGNLLLLHIRLGGTATITIPTGWTELGSRNDTGSTYWLGRIADGTEGASVTISFSASSRIVAEGYRITGWFGTLATGVAVAFHSANENTPPNLAPEWGSAETLWLAGLSARRSDWTPTATPANFTNQLGTANTSNTGTDRVRIISARRELEAASLQPGAWTISGTADNPHVSTVAIRPEGAAAHTDAEGDLTPLEAVAPDGTATASASAEGDFTPLTLSAPAGEADTHVPGQPVLYWTVFLDGASPTAAQVVSGMAWGSAVAAGHDDARATTGEQSFPEVTGLAPGSYRAAFVWYNDTDYSSVSISDIEVVGSAAESAEGSFATLSLSAPEGTQTFAGAATGAFEALSLTEPSGASVAAVSASGAFEPISLTAPEGTGTSEAAESASGGFEAILLAAPDATVTTSVAVSGSFAELSLTAPTGVAETGANVIASGSFAELSLTAPNGSTTQASSATGAFAAITLSAPEGNASTEASVAASGEFAPITISTLAATVTSATTASGEFAQITLSAPEGFASTEALTEVSGGFAALAFSTLSGTVGVDSAGSGVMAGISIIPPDGFSWANDLEKLPFVAGFRVTQASQLSARVAEAGVSVRVTPGTLGVRVEQQHLEVR